MIAHDACVPFPFWHKIPIEHVRCQRGVLMRSITGLFFLFLATLISAGEPKLKKGDRQIIGDQLDYGRKAAEFGLWNEAIFHWEKVIAKDPNNASATNNLAVAYESVGAYEKAEAMYRTAIDLNEDNAEIRKNMKRFSSFYRKHKKTS